MAESNPKSDRPLEPGEELAVAARAKQQESDAIAQAANAPSPVPIFTAATEDEGQIVRGLLESEGIPAIFNSWPTAAFGTALVGGETHWSDVLVAPEDADRAKALIESYQAGPPPEEGEP